MNKTELLHRQQALLQKSARLREQLKIQSRVLVKPLGLLDQGRRLAQWLGRHPVLPASALVLGVVLKPKRALVWGGRLLWAWKTSQTVKKWMMVNRKI